MITISNILECEGFLEDTDAVIFDLDDTLYSEKEYVRSGYCAVARVFPQIKDMERKLWNEFLKNLPAIDSVLEQEGLLAPEYKDEALRAYRYHTPKITLYPGVMELLLRLKQKKKMGLITDGRPEGQWAKIEALNIAHCFDRIIVTDELGGVEFRKPNNTAFLMMREQLGVNFKEMCYIGDNTQKDFVAPEKLGMRSICFRNADGLYSL